MSSSDYSLVYEQMTRRSTEFGGPWTQEKLGILEKYLDAYTTVLKNKPFRIIYIDAFAGSGHIDLQYDEHGQVRRLLNGSAIRAALIVDRPFDELIFVEKDPENCRHLTQLKSDYPDRTIEIINSDANDFLSSFNRDWRRCRGVLFLDPFGAEVEWATLERIAQFNALDTWILFPVATIARLLPTRREPDDISQKWADKLTKVYGDDSWRELYRDDPQQSLFGKANRVRASGVDGLVRIYKGKLRTLFGPRYLDNSRELKNSTNSVLYEFMFCAGSRKSRAIGIAKRIADHILINL